jgi:4-azaleucine resistance transporter AzlC
MRESILKRSIVDSAPAFFGYLPLGIAFGLLSFESTQNMWLGPAMSLFVYAGAAQYMSLNIIAAKGSLLDLSFMTFIVNLRHIFYGIPFLNIFSKAGWKQFYLIFGITDETYSILTASPIKKDVSYCQWVTLLTHSYWVIGTIIGSVLSSYLLIDLSFLDFTLTALFVVLTVEQAYAVKSPQPFIIGGISLVLAIWIPSDHFLTVCMSLCLGLSIIDSKRKNNNYAHQY